MAEKLLIVNADDFGFTEGINEGIIRTHSEGVVTSTSVMTRGEAASEAAALGQFPELSVGLHFQIADKDLEKRVRRGERLTRGEVAQLERDFHVQLEAFTDLTGKTPTHVDGHYSAHTHPDTQPFIERFCVEHQIPRRETDAKLIRDFFGRDEAGNSDVQRVSEGALLKIVDCLAEGVNELMCHPGMVDGDLNRVTGYTHEREVELETLTAQRVKERLHQLDIELVSWTDSRILVRT